MTRVLSVESVDWVTSATGDAGVLILRMEMTLGKVWVVVQKSLVDRRESMVRDAR